MSIFHRLLLLPVLTAALVLPAAAQPVITLDPPQLAFDSVSVATDSTLDLWVGNSGTSDLVVGELLVQGSDAAQFTIAAAPIRPFIIPPDGPRRRIRMRFTPATRGPKVALLSIINNITGTDTTNVVMEGFGTAPAITTEPASLPFGNVWLDSIAQRTLTIRNPGEETLVVDSLTLVFNNDGYFSLFNPPALPLSVPPGGDSPPITVRYAPGTRGFHVSNLRIASNVPGGSPLFVLFSGTGIAPEITVAPDSLGYGATTVGLDSVRVLTIGNTGNTGLRIEGIDLVGPDTAHYDFAPPPPLPTVVPPGEELAVSVRFAPQSTGLKRAFTVITTNDPGNNPVTIPLGGRGVVPDIASTPLSVAFDTVTVGQSATRFVEIRNDGAGILVISQISTVGQNQGDFSVSSAPPLPITIPAGGDPVQVGIDFAPRSIGQRRAFLSLITNDPDENPFFVALAGFAIEPDIVAEPESFAFGSLPVGEEMSLPLVIRNVGDADLVISDTLFVGQAPGSYQLVGFPPLPLVLAAGGDSVAVALRFRPTRAGALPASLRIRNNDPDEDPLDLPITGTGIEPDIAATPNPLDFGAGRLDSTLTRLLTIVNEGGVTLVVTDTALRGESADRFALLDFPELPLSIGPEESVSVRLTFRPDSLGDSEARLDLTSNDPDEVPYPVTLLGRGVLPDIDPVPDSLAFDSVRVKTDSLQVVRIFNIGSDDLVLRDTALVGPDRGDFRLTISTDLPAVIPPNSFLPVVFGVWFAPGSLGEKTAALRLFSDDPDEGVLDVPLRGIGVEPNIVTASDSVHFGEVVLSTTGQTTLPLYNSGGAPLLVEGLAFGGPDSLAFALSSPVAFPTTVAPGDSLPLRLSFFPTGERRHEGMLDIFSDDPDAGTISLALSGTGILPVLALDAATVNFGVVATGRDSAAVLTIRNLGSGGLLITDVILEGGQAEAFALDDSLELPLEVRPEVDGYDLPIRFQPGATGRAVALLTLRSNDIATPEASVALRGRAVNPPTVVEIATDSLLLGVGGGVQITVSADTTLRSVELFYGQSGSGLLGDTLQLLPVEPGRFAGDFPASATTTAGITAALRMRDDFPVTARDTFHLSVAIPEGVLSESFADGRVDRWFMYSLPFRTAAVTDAAITSVLADLGPEGDFSWKIYRTDGTPESENYLGLTELQNSGSYGRFEPGNAFWLYLRDDRDSNLPSTDITLPAMTTLPADSFVMTLQPGWNQIGLPYDFAMTWGQVAGPYRDSLQVYHWDGDGWSESLARSGWRPLLTSQFSLLPRDGYAVRNPLAEPVAIVFHPGRSADSSGVLARGTGAGWRIVTRVEDDCHFDIAVLGEDLMAREGRDHLDFVDPAMPGGVRLGQYFRIGNGAGRFCSDLRPPGAGDGVWYFTVTADRNTVDWRLEDVAGLPPDHQVLLYDTKYRERHSVLPGSTVKLRNLNSGEVDRFALLVGRPGDMAGRIDTLRHLQPSQFRLFSNYPNPFNPATTLRFELPEAGRVLLTIHNVLGQRVRLLIDGERPAGFYEMRWDGRSEAGTRTASGLYFYTLQLNGRSQTGKMLKLQ